MEAYDTDKVVVLDQGSRPGRSLVDSREEGQKRTLIVDHHMSDEVSLFSSHDARMELILVSGRIASPDCMPYGSNSDSCAVDLLDVEAASSGYQRQRELESCRRRNGRFGSDQMGYWTLARRIGGSTESVSSLLFV
jgi:hypothetical protein